jgi:hypothetical protein
MFCHDQFCDSLARDESECLFRKGKVSLRGGGNADLPKLKRTIKGTNLTIELLYNDLQLGYRGRTRK